MSEAGSAGRKRSWVWLGIAIVIAGGVGLWRWAGRTDREAQTEYRRGLALLQEGQAEDGRSALERVAVEYPASDWADDALLALGQSLQAEGRTADARGVFTQLLERYPERPIARQAADRLAQLNAPGGAAPATSRVAPASAAVSATRAQPAAPLPAAGETVYIVQAGDTLTKIARQFGTTVDAIRQANGISGDLIYPKQQLRIITQNTAPGSSTNL